MYDRPLIIGISFFAAVIPVLLWLIILKRKKRQHMMPRFFLTFFFSGLGAMFFMQNEEIWKEYLKFQGLNIFMIWIIFGAGIEYFKNYMVRIWGFRYFKNIDDVMDLSFAAALGFTFFENFFQFLVTFSGLNPEIDGPIKMIKYFLTREFFILPIHLFCSGIFGYFYGVGLFAGDELKRKHHKTGFFRFFRFFLFFIPTRFVYKSVKILQGTIISVFFYSLFFTLLEEDPSLTTLFLMGGFEQSPIHPVDEKLMPIISFFFFKVGTVILFNLMDQRRRWKVQGLVSN